VGLRGYLACRILKQHGFANVKNLSGGYRTYEIATGRQSNEGIFRYDDAFSSSRVEAPIPPQDEKPSGNTIEVDACGLQCPGPIMQVYNAMQGMKPGDVLQIKASDPGFEGDIKVWCQRTGHKLLDIGWQGRTLVARIQKSAVLPEEQQAEPQSHDKAMIVFSGDLDKAIASFIIANGAASMGRKVTMFFTFWGLNILRKPEKVPVHKDFLSKMFGAMMPRGSMKLPLSRMNMFGIGPKLIRHLMKEKNIFSLEELIQQAIKNGVRIVACNMSMDIMGIKKEELIDGVEIGGVASFIGAAEQSDASLFI
jgi:peroxiredoxin family protein/TusA-related sulfurtransferase